MPVEIPLTRGMVSVVDDEDYPLVKHFRWKAKPMRNGNGKCYAVRMLRVPRKTSKTTIYMHRVIVGATKGQLVDHINRDPLDNRRQNLRLADPSQNATNTSHKVGASGFRGVSLSRNRFVASIWVKRRIIRLGSFSSAIEAAIVRDSAARVAYGAFARLNFPDATP